MKLSLALLLFSLAGGAALADYSMLWFNISGGGGTSTNSQYSLRGIHRFNPHAGGAMTTARISVTGGFWAITFVPTPDAPTLHLTNAAPGSVTLLVDSAGARLTCYNQFNDSLASGSLVQCA